MYLHISGYMESTDTFLLYYIYYDFIWDTIMRFHFCSQSIGFMIYNAPYLKSIILNGNPERHIF